MGVFTVMAIVDSNYTSIRRLSAPPQKPTRGHRLCAARPTIGGGWPSRPTGSVADGGRNHAGDLGERIHGHALVGVGNGGVAEAVQHHVAVLLQVDGAWLL